MLPIKNIFKYLMKTIRWGILKQDDYIKFFDNNLKKIRNHLIPGNDSINQIYLYGLKTGIEYVFNNFKNKYNFVYIDDVFLQNCDICFYNAFIVNYWEIDELLNRVKGNPIFVVEFLDHPCYPLESNDKTNITFKKWTNNYKNYSISQFADTDKNLYMPGVNFDRIKYHIESRQKFDLSIKTKFANWVCSNPCLPRKKIIDYINKYYKHIDYYGNIWYGDDQNNKGLPLNSKFWEDSDIHHQYKFNFAFENTPTKNKIRYITEKIEHGYCNNSIPIYWGCSDIIKLFNEESFINVCELNIKQMIHKISIVDNNDELYRHMFYAYPFKDRNFDYAGYFYERKVKFFKNILEQI